MTMKPIVTFFICQIYYLTKFHNDWIKIGFSIQLLVLHSFTLNFRPPAGDTLERFLEIFLYQKMCNKMSVTGAKFHAKTIIKKNPPEGDLALFSGIFLGHGNHRNSVLWPLK